ncbi:MAG: amino acid amidase [Alphaproteobacteria bacterium]|nr:amino acid amidase [Alphaproteobacteria bacterium]
MKVYISADIEGLAAITHWDEADHTHRDYRQFREEMTREVLAACDGATAAGATEILIKDAHHTGRNILVADLPAHARIIRGWSGHPLCMLQELDETFAAVVLIGYHDSAGSETNPLAHTLTMNINDIHLNGVRATEFRLHAYAALTFGVPVVFVSGDAGLAEGVKAFNPRIHGLAVKRGIGDSTISMAPRKACDAIRAGVEAALRDDRAAMRAALPTSWTLEVKYSDPVKAYRAAQYPGARHGGDRTVRFETDVYMDVLRMLLFVM